ncbi:MAG: succinylglutamate desuccinylase/aspartoacylase family protein [Deltaproteobacteria bacterium]|nr:succinylglutamate desuccinylase/aspartoacylase family protein [Deltaproteobacteria bacterium]
MKTILRKFDRPAVGDIPAETEAFLRVLGGAAAIHVAGKDRSRSRVVTTLLHGNEPSGTCAIHAWLRSGSQPAVDAVLVVANVEAALATPGFAHRALPGRRDLNRCFLGPWDDAEGRLAREILELVHAQKPEALIDLHNNTGHNPPYGVGVEPSPEALQLVVPFGNRFVWSHLTLGALMEAMREIPSVTIEVGRTGDSVADAVALRGLTRFLEDDRVIEPGLRPDIQVLTAPMRVCVRRGISLAVVDTDRGEKGTADLTILADLDRHNFERVEAGTKLGYVRGEAWPLELLDEDGRDRASFYFTLEDGVLRTRRPIIPIMITTDPGIATSDCLFYVVRELEPRNAAGSS